MGRRSARGALARLSRWCVLPAVLTLALAAAAPAQAVGTTITTVAGGSTEGDSGDGGAATSASFELPQALVHDTLGNLYVSDPADATVRKISALGVISLVAGTHGTHGDSGDSGQATSAELYWPRGLSYDTAHNYLFIADATRIRRVNLTSGVISTVAGTGTAGYNGDGTATTSQVNWPSALDFAGGDLYLADTLNQRVRVLDSGGDLTTVAGNGDIGECCDAGGPATSAELREPAGIAVHVGLLSTTVYVADSEDDIIAAFTVGGNISTYAGTVNTPGHGGDGSAATGATLNWPSGISTDELGNLYIADTRNHEIRKVTALTGVITTVAGNGTDGFSGDNGPATSAQLHDPKDVVADLGTLGRIWIADTYNYRIRAVGIL